MFETKKLKRIFDNIENYEGIVKSFVKGTFNKNQILKSLSNNHPCLNSIFQFLS